MLGDEGVVAIAEGLRVGGCPVITVVKMSFVGMGSEGGKALARAFGSGRCPLIQHLDISTNWSVGDGAVHELLLALGGGRATGLMELGLMNVGMATRSSATLVTHLKCSSTWPQLSALKVRGNTMMGDAFGRELAVVLERGGGARLRVLAVYECGLGEMGSERLACALTRGACPMLEMLWVGRVKGVEWGEVMGRRKSVVDVRVFNA